MTSPNNPEPQYLRYVESDVPNIEATKARPVTIIDLPTGDGGPAVQSINGQTGVVTLDAADVNALPASYTPPAVSWGSVTGKPTTFAPATHTHVIGDVTGLQAAIDGKAATSHNHTVAQITGLQATITDLTDRIEALEAAAE